MRVAAIIYRTRVTGNELHTQVALVPIEEFALLCAISDGLVEAPIGSCVAIVECYHSIGLN